MAHRATVRTLALTKMGLLQLPPLFTICLTSVVSTLSYALCFPSLAPFLKELAGSETDTRTNGWLGTAVAVYSLAKVIAAPLAGRAIQHLGLHPTLALQICLLALASFGYGASPSAVRRLQHSNARRRHSRLHLHSPREFASPLIGRSAWSWREG